LPRAALASDVHQEVFTYQTAGDLPDVTADLRHGVDVEQLSERVVRILQ
jgi:hypothetical protein